MLAEHVQAFHQTEPLEMYSQAEVLKFCQVILMALALNTAMIAAFHLLNLLLPFPDPQLSCCKVAEQALGEPECLPAPPRLPLAPSWLIQTAAWQ